MPQDLYIKEKLSDRKPRKSYRFPLFLAIGLGIIATILALIFNQPKSNDVEPAQTTATSQLGVDAENAAATPPKAGKPAKETPAAPPHRDILGLLRQSEDLADADKLVEAREQLLRVLKVSDNAVVLNKARGMLNSINTKLLLTPRSMPGKQEYMVKSGDTLDKIAKKFGITVSLIQKSNDIRGHLIHPGQRLRIPSSDFSIRVDKSENTLTVKYNGQYFKSYKVGTGKYEKTPTGKSKVTDRIAQPTWWRPDGKPIPYGSPDNLLGTHWLALDIPGYGIHGTWEPETIGKYESAGCIRMLNENIEELYTIIPLGTPVTIEE